MNRNVENNASFIIFKTQDEQVSVDVRFEEETVWLTQEQIAVLFGKAKSTINEHIKNIYSEKELEEVNTIKKFGISEFQQKAFNYYNLDVIISVGYRVKSLRGTQFRQWATKRLNECIRKGFTMDNDRLNLNQAEINILSIRNLNSIKYLNFKNKNLIEVRTFV